MSTLQSIPAICATAIARHALVRGAAIAMLSLCVALPAPLVMAQETSVPSEEMDAEEEEDLFDPDDALSDYDPNMEEIVIKGQKGAGMDAGETDSVITFDASELANLGAQDVSDLAKITPNLEINTISASTPTFFIRGVGLNDFAANSTGAVAIYQDGIPINAPALQLGQLFDSGGVQVKRGPQTYGNERNASAGVIAMESRMPSGNLGSTLRIDLGRFGRKDFEGAIEFPITRDESLSSRISFRYTDREPIVFNRCGGLDAPTQGACGSSASPLSTPVPAGLPSWVNDSKRWGMRGLFRFQPPDSDMEWILNVHGAQIDQDSQLGQVIGTSTSRAETSSKYIDPAVSAIYDTVRARLIDSGLTPTQSRRPARDATLKLVTDDIGLAQPFANDYNLVGAEELGSYGGNVRGEIPIGDFQLTTITGAETYTRSRETDFDFSPDTALETDADDRAWQLTQSLELDAEMERIPLAWRVGGYFLMERLDSNTLFTLNFRQNATLPNRNILQDYAQDLYSLGLYANLDWDFHEDFTLSGGARFNFEKKNFDISLPDHPTSVPSFDSDTWTAPTGAISLTYRPTEFLSVYSKYSRGWKPGLFNAAILTLAGTAGGQQVAPEIKLTDPEQIDSFEVGMISHWFDETLEIRGTFFYYKYVDYQVFMLKNRFGSPPQFEIINADDAQIYGVEADVYAQPLLGRVPDFWEQLSLETRFSWLESKFLNFTDSRTIAIANQAVTQLISYSGNRLPNTPRFKVSGSVWWTFEFGRYGTFIPRYDVAYTDDVFFDPSEGVGTPSPGTGDLPQYAIGQRAYTLHDIRLTYRLPGEKIEISGWVRNVGDERYKTYTADATTSIRSLLNWVGDPRTFGASMKFDW